MAFTPQSSPTRVSTISFVIRFNALKLRKKLYYIHNLLALNGTVAPSTSFIWSQWNLLDPRSQCVI